MITMQSNAKTNETAALRQEIDGLKDRLARLSEASIGISQNPSVEAALQQIAESV